MDGGPAHCRRCRARLRNAREVGGGPWQTGWAFRANRWRKRHLYFAACPARSPEPSPGPAAREPLPIVDALRRELYFFTSTAFSKRRCSIPALVLFSRWVPRRRTCAACCWRGCVVPVPVRGPGPVPGARHGSGLRWWCWSAPPSTSSPPRSRPTRCRQADRHRPDAAVQHRLGGAVAAGRCALAGRRWLAGGALTAEYLWTVRRRRLRPRRGADVR